MARLATFASYQKRSRRTWNRIVVDHAILYPTLGLTNEAGEVAGKIKKIFRDNAGKFREKDRHDIKKELGDVLWYLAQICTELDLSLEEVAEENLSKLKRRQESGTLHGDGDDR